jgi:hypothetical protein
MNLEDHAPDDSHLRMDAGIRDAVLILRRGGVETFESCEGGEGHAFPEPTVRFHGDAWAGYHAFSIAMQNGLRVSAIRHTYVAVEGQLHGPYWEITLREKLS